MATVSRHNRQPSLQHIQGQPHGAAPEAARTPAPAAASQRRRWKLWMMLGATLVVVWLLPSIVAHTPILTWAVRSATGDLNGTVHVQSASLGWFSPIAATGIEVCDAKNQTVLQAPAVSSEKSLLGLLWNRSSPGKFRLENPKFDLHVRSDGSNVEDLLAKYLASQEPSSRYDLALEIVDGSITITDDEALQSWRIEKLRLALSTSQSAGAPLKLETSAEVADTQRPGRVACKLTLPAGETAPGDAGELHLETNTVPLAMFQRLAARLLPQTRLDGRLSSKLDARWGGNASTTLQGEINADGLVLAAQALGKDELRLERLQATFQGAWQDRRLEIQQSAVDCDVGNLEALGTLDLSDKAVSNLSNILLRQTYDVRARIDLARLARLLPGTLRIRKGTEITSGQVAVMLSSQKIGGERVPPATPGPSDNTSGGTPAIRDGMAWQARIDVGKLTAVDQGRQLAWEKPIQCSLAAHETPDGPVIDNLRCISEFLNIQASGTPERLAASLSFDLQKLADQLGRFVELRGVTLSGEGWANLNWARSGQTRDRQVGNSPQDGKQELVGECQIRKFQLAVAGKPPWAEEGIAATLLVQGGTNLWTDRRVDAAELHVRAGADQLDVRLLQPVVDPNGAWSLGVKGQGQLERWPARLRSFLPTDSWRLSGAFQLAARADVGQDGASIEQARVRITPLAFASPSLNLQESAELTASGSWDFRQGRCQIKAATLTTSAVSARATDLVLLMPDASPWQFTGAVEYRGDLDRLRAWFMDTTRPPAWALSGQLTGTAQLQPSAGRIQARVEAEVQNLAIVSGGDKFQEPRIHLRAVGNYQPQSGALKLDQCELTSAALGAKASGQLTPKQGQSEVQMSGEVSYDWEKVCALAQPWTSSWIQFSGRGAGPFSYRGPFSLEAGEAFASACWERANISGFPLGAGELKARLAGGVLQADPLDVPCSQGRLILTPSLRLSPGPLELTLARGAQARRVQITPGMCAAALKYAAPLLADVAVAQGAFSIELDGCRLPFSDPSKGELAGRLVIHSVEIGPGPLIQELAMLMNRAGTAKLKRESVVPFRMVQGRVYHQNLELEFPDLTIRTFGSVGISDQSLAIMTEMPVPPKWIGNNPVGDALKNKVIRLPLGGTLSRPQLDRQEMARASRALLGDAARNTLENEVNKQLERLLTPGR